MMKLRIHSIIENTLVEGPGNRTCIFVQGCIKECPGCNSPQTWDLNGGKECDVTELARKILSNKTIEGVTFSGGEPLLQSKALYELGLILKRKGLSIVVFTGFTDDLMEDVNDANWNKLLSITDLLITGPYEEDKKTNDKIWVGSYNQEYHFLSDTYKELEDKLDELDNKVEIRLNNDGSIVVNGMGDNKKIKKMFKNVIE